ncbi:Hypothetical Protein FCC1311_010482 [Hondaea fermentalgiana]|uniref:Calmodulin n=1 Tax=Hondaea fermentalgiana TaxID=2315210 RepID=A0A2R5G1E8_9STRA|nr:Hypothetical Protein FCC1311_010482 [Hondaea fermentalgiana]|eukprot:GBG24830.1 Hypothetical Protein FCC1311_010482 [Hondaea fermentalgiana]
MSELAASNEVLDGIRDLQAAVMTLEGEVERLQKNCDRVVAYQDDLLRVCADAEGGERMPTATSDGGAYDALRDPHCQVARRKHVQKRLVAVEREAKRARVAESAGAKSPKNRKGKNHANAVDALVQRSTSTQSGGVTFQRPSGSDPQREVEVLKCIVLRENYIERIRGLSGAALAEKQHEFVDLADLLRSVTVDVIDNIAKWKRGAPAGSQFVWNGTNYLLRIPSDLDFLQKSNTITAWLGASARHDKNQDGLASADGMSPSPTFAITAPREKVDMIRVLEAERIILQEEEMHGVFTRNSIGQVVPAALGKDEANTHGRHTLKVREQHASSADDEGSEVPARDRRHWPNGTYMMEKAKQGGETSPLHRHHARGRKSLPKRRSRGAQLDLDIRRARAENESLEKDLHAMETILERARADLATLEAETTQDEVQNVGGLDESQDLARRQRDALVKASFVSKTEIEVERRRIDLEHRAKLLERKEAVQRQFHERQLQDQLRMRKETIERKQRQGDAFAAAVDIPDGEVPEHEFGEPVDEADLNLEEEAPVRPLVRVEDAAAIQIERVVRGRLGRLRFARVHALHSRCALSMQSVWRGHQGRLRAKLVRTRRDASVLIESLWRGCVARKRVWEIRTAKRRQEAAIQIEKLYRGLRGRRRAANKRRLQEYGLAAIALTNSFFQSDLLELAAAKADEIEPEALTLVKCCLLLTARGTCAPEPHVERLINWKACKRGLRRPYFLDKVRALAIAARAGCLYLHEDRITAVRRHMHDPNLTVKRMAFLKRGSRAAQFLLQWLQDIVICQEIVPEFIEPGAYEWSEWKAVIAAEDPEGLEVWEPADTDYDSDVIDPDNYVPEEITRCRITRPRPLLIAIADDVPCGARAEICEQLKRTLPGTFVHVAHDKFEVDILQEILDGGHSIILDVTVGMGARQRNAFNRRFAVARSTLEPRPMFVLVKGCDRNRGPRELNQGARNAESRNWPPSILAEEERYTGVDSVARAVLSTSSRLGTASLLDNDEDYNDHNDYDDDDDNDDDDDDDGDKGRDLDSADGLLRRKDASALVKTTSSSSSHNDPETVNTRLKLYLEDRCSAEFLFASPSSKRQLIELSKAKNPPPALVMILETVIILLTPHQTFSGPENRVGAVSWEQALPLLDLSTGDLSERMAAVDVHNIPVDNVNAIFEYFAHDGFPKEGGAPHEAIVSYPIAGTLLWWVRSVAGFARLLDEEGGPPQVISKSSSPVFSSVVIVRDGIQKFPSGYEPRQDHWPTQCNGDLAMQSDGWKRALISLMSVTLRDVKVYSASITVPAYESPTTHLAPQAKKAAMEAVTRVRLVVSIHRDPITEAFFFLAYVPRDSANYTAVVPVKDINKLLGPNSVEMRDPRRPPRDDVQLYRRLLELLALERPRQRVFGAPPHPYELRLRRKRQRLLRTARKLDATMATITASELAPGELLLDAYEAATSRALSVRVDQEAVERICKATSSNRERKDLLSKRGNRMVLHLVDRLSIRRATTRRPAELIVHHGVIPGRKIFEGSVVLSSKKHVVSVHVATATKALRVVTYYPPTSYRAEFLLSARARLQLLGSLNEGDRNRWLEKLFARLHLHKPGSISNFGRTMSGSSEVSETDERVAVLDKSIHKLTHRVQRLDLDHDPAKPRGALLVLEFCISPTQVRIQGQDDDRFYEDDLQDDSILANFREGAEPTEVLDIMAYDKVSGARYRLGLSDEQMDQLLGTSESFDGSEASFAALAATLRLQDPKDSDVTTINDRRKKNVVGKVSQWVKSKSKAGASEGGADDPSLLVAIHEASGTIVRSAETKLPEREKPSAQESARDPTAAADSPSAAAQMPSLPEVISAEVLVENLDATRSIPVGERSSKPSGLLVYRHGHKIGQAEGRYVIFEVWRQNSIDSAQDAAGNRFNHPVSPLHAYRLEAYEPATEHRAAIVLDTADSLRAAVGGRQDLLAADREGALIAFLLQERLYLDPDANALSLCVAQSRLYSVDKVTPVQKNMFVDATWNSSQDSRGGSGEDGAILVLPTHTHAETQERGFKILSVGHSVPLQHETTSGLAEVNVLTFFEDGMDELYKEQGGGRAPRLRIYAYNPQRQTNIVLFLQGPDLIEALEGDRLMLAAHRRQEMVRQLVPLLRIRRSLDPSVPDVLLLPWAKLRRERLFAAPPPTKGSKIKAATAQEGLKLFSTGMFTSSGVSVIITAQLVSAMGSSAELTMADGHGPAATLWLQVYEPARGLKAFVRVPEIDETRAILHAARGGVKQAGLTRQLVVELLRARLRLQHLHDEADGQTALVANLDGVETPEEAEAHLKMMSEVGVGVSVEDVAGEHHPMPEPVSPDGATSSDKLYLLPSVVSGSLLAKRVGKLSGMYTVLTAHALVDKDDETNVRGVHVRAYCPTVSQQASTSVEMERHQAEQGEEPLKTFAAAVLESAEIEFDGVQAHMKVIVKASAVDASANVPQNVEEKAD